MVNPKVSHLAIIGGGASGTIALIKACATLPSHMKVTIFDPNAEIGLGLAYSTTRDEHLLNVPAERMSIDQDHPLDFLRWCSQELKQAEEKLLGQFLPRKYFGAYLKDKISKILFNRYRHHPSKVTSLSRKGSQWKLVTDDGVNHLAELVILATGFNDDQSTDKLLKPKNNFDAHCLNPYDSEAMSKVKTSDQVLIIGSGLTALDAFLQILNQNPTQKINFISRHGLFPLPHAQSHPTDSEKIILPKVLGLSPLQMLRVFRAYLLMHPNSLHQLVQQLRVNTKDIWNYWSWSEKRSFMNHLKPYWEIIRHRTPSESWSRLENSIREKHSTVIAGRIDSTQLSNEKVQVEFFPRGANKKQTLIADKLILATGAQINQNIESGFTRGFRKCPLGLGYVHGGAPGLWILGPASKTSHWESTAIPEINQHADQIIEEIVAFADQTESTLPISPFSYHPNQINETYFQHMKEALRFAYSLSKDAVALTVHAVVPFLFSDKASDHIRGFSQMLTRRKLRQFRNHQSKKTSKKTLKQTLKKPVKKVA